MTPLPIDEHLPLILARLKESRCLVLVAEPGAGKTTRVPPAIVKSNLLGSENPHLVMLQPRRVAARTSAQRIADENGWKIGNEVGWHVRFDKQIKPHTKLRVLTEGILTRQLIDDPYLENIGAIVLDEFHERSIHTDMTIALLREIRQTVRSDLMLIVMSATLDAKPVAEFLGGCPIVQVPGRTFPIEIQHAAVPSGDSLPERVEKVLPRVIDEGDVLVFLPGAYEINRTAQRVSSRYRDALVLPLHGSLSPEEQNRALQPSKQRKVILATNIAETSLTIEGVRIVIDSGLARVASYDPQRGLDRLDLKRISKASATQRAGRAGRTAPGKCVRLYAASEFHAMDDFELPEIRRVDLAGTVLSLHAWGKPDPRKFGWYDPPDEQTLLAAEQLLEMLGALEDGQITPLGRQMVSLPTHPRLARLLIGSAEEDLLEDGAALAARLSEKEDSPQLPRTRDELIRIGRSIKPNRIRKRAPDEAMLRLSLLAYPDRVCRRRENNPSAGVMVGGGGMKLAGDLPSRYEFFVALDARQDDRAANREAVVKTASGIEEKWLEELFPHQIKKERVLTFDAQRQRVVGWGTVKYRNLILREDRDAPVDPQEAGQILAEALSRQAADFLDVEWLARLEFLKRAMPEHPWPTIDPQDILAEMCRGKRSVQEIGSSVPFLLSRLTYPLDRIFEKEAPETIAVPTGNHIKVEYKTGQPVLAVRLQEMFGLVDTPRVAGGRIAVLLHLLGPNYRPVQITDDLRSFWKTTYFQVRKDLRVRYPKHSWPEDPLTAQPQAKGRSRR